MCPRQLAWGAFAARIAGLQLQDFCVSSCASEAAQYSQCDCIRQLCAGVATSCACASNILAQMLARPPTASACKIKVGHGSHFPTRADRASALPSGSPSRRGSGPRLPLARTFTILRSWPAAWDCTRLRVGAVSQYRRVLEPSHRDFHAAGRYLHPALRILRRAQRQARPNRVGRAAAGGRSGRHAWPEAYGRHQRESR